MPRERRRATGSGTGRGKKPWKRGPSDKPSFPLKPKPKPKPEPKRAPRKKGPPRLTADGTPLRSHQVLDDELRKLASGIAKVAEDEVTAIAAPEGYKGGEVDRVGRSPKILGADTFNRQYRDAYPGMDETVSTSAVRALRTGFYETPGRSKADLEKGRVLFENLSKRSRIATELVGFSTAEAKMQHPTTDDLARFAEDKKTRSPHSYLDRERKQFVLEAGKEAAQDKGATLETVLNAMEAAAASFTANRMAAPATASNVQPFLRRGADEEVKTLAPVIEPRERLKRRARELDAPVASAIADETRLESLARRWPGTRVNLREVSPERGIATLVKEAQRARDLEAGRDPKRRKTAGSSPLGGGVAKPTSTFPTKRTPAASTPRAAAAAADDFRGRTRTRNQNRMRQQAAEESGAAEAMELLV